MTDITKITLSDGKVYAIKDEEARKLIAALGTPTHYLGVTTTVITDGAPTSPIAIGDEMITPSAGDIVAYGSSEFVWSEIELKWREFGSTGSIKALAFKDTASADYTPAGSVSAPTITVTPGMASVTPFGDAGKLPSCTFPKMTATVEDETLVFGWSEGSFNAGALPSGGTPVKVATGIESASASAPTFTGTAATITVD